MSNLQPEFWSGKSVFLTGHTGFKGTWMTLVLNRLGARVHGYALEPITSPDMFETVGAEKSCASHVIGDVNNFDSLKSALTAAAPDIMIHMAAQPIVSTGYTQPVETFQTNIMGTVHFLEAMRAFGSGTALVVSSDKCYLNKELDQSFSEDDALGGFDPYSASKAGTEIAVNAWRKSFFEGNPNFKLASARAGNVIGGGDWAADRLLPDAARALAEKQSVVVRSPQSTRPWQHVLEPVFAYLLLIQCMDGCDGLDQGWNVGPIPPDASRVQKVMDIFVDAWPDNDAGWISPEDSSCFNEAKTLSLNCESFSRKTGWKPVLSLQEAIEWTADWYASYYLEDKESARSKTLGQIDLYNQRFSR